MLIECWFSFSLKDFMDLQIIFMDQLHVAVAFTEEVVSDKEAIYLNRKVTMAFVVIVVGVAVGAVSVADQVDGENSRMKSLYLCDN